MTTTIASACRAAGLAGLLLAALPAPRAADAPQAIAQPTQPDLRADVAAHGADLLVKWTQDAFRISDEMTVDADVHRRLDALTAGFAERQRPVFERWMRELADTPEGRRDPIRATYNAGTRYFVALANWRLRSGGAAHEALLRQAAAKPADCRLVDDATTPIDEVAALLQATPPAQRDAFMEGERQLLAQWDGATPVVDVGDEDPARDVARWVQDIRRGGPPATLPMATRLAGLVFADPPQQAAHAARCSARQWWLANRLKQAPAASEAIWQAWRLAFASDLMLMRARTASVMDLSSTEYPNNVRQMGIEGNVMVRVERDVRGRFVSGAVTKRQLASRFLPADMPIPMLDRLLDGPSLARARKLVNEQAAAAAPGASDVSSSPSLVQFSWRIE